MYDKFVHKMECVPFDVLFTYLDVECLCVIVQVSRTFNSSILDRHVRVLCDSANLPHQVDFQAFYRLYRSSTPTAPSHDFAMRCIKKDNWYGIRNMLKLCSTAEPQHGFSMREVYHSMVLTLLGRSIEYRACHIVKELCDVALVSLLYPFTLLDQLYDVTILQSSLYSNNGPIIRCTHALVMKAIQEDTEDSRTLREEIDFMFGRNSLRVPYGDESTIGTQHMGCLIEKSGDKDALDAITELYGYNGRCSCKVHCRRYTEFVASDSESLDILRRVCDRWTVQQ